jgi:hypothetical protein
MDRGIWLKACLRMEKPDWLKFTRPYNLRDRLFEFACVITHLVHYLQRNGIWDVAAGNWLSGCYLPRRRTLIRMGVPSSPNDSRRRFIRKRS